MTFDPGGSLKGAHTARHSYSTGARLSFFSKLSSAALVLALTAACAPGPDAERVVDEVLTTSPFNGAFAVIVPSTLPADCDKLPDSEEGKAWGILVKSGFMKTEPSAGSDTPSCNLLLTDRGAKRKTFGKIVKRDDSYEVPVGGIGTDLPTYETTGSSDSVNVSFTWKFYRFRGVDGLIALDKLPQRKMQLSVAEVPPAGKATAMFRRHDGAWDLEAIKLVQ